MSVDLSKLSSKELFELAKQREQEEQQAVVRLENLNAARVKREELIAKHEAAIAATDKAIQELQEQREQQLTDFEAALAPLELEISELEGEVKADEARAEEEAAEPQRTLAPAEPPRPQNSNTPRSTAATPQASEATPPRTVSKGSNTTDDLYKLIRSMMRNRTYISESLMKEKLKAAAFDTSNLRNQLDQLIYEKRLDKKGAGNYTLGKRK
jgi:FtsZ-interacting cell division protein ZipA